MTDMKKNGDEEELCDKFKDEDLIALASCRNNGRLMKLGVSG